MNGAKGGIRDWILALFFSKKKNKGKQDDNKNELKNKKNPQRVITQTNEPLTNENKTININNKENTQRIITQTNEPLTNENKTININNKEKTIDILPSEPISNNKVSEPAPKNIKPEIENEVKKKEETTQPSLDKPKTNIIEKKLVQDKNIDDEYIEFLLVETIEQIIHDDLNELERIKFELDVLSQKEDDEVLTKEVEKLKKQLEELLEKFKKLKDKYYRTQKNNELEKIDDEDLYYLLEEYKHEIKNNDLLNDFENQINTINEYITFIDKLILIENETEQLDEKIDEKLDRFEIRDEEFEKMKEDYQNVEDVYSLIDDFNKKQDSILNNLDDKVKKAEEINTKVVTTIEYIPHINRLINAALLFAASKRIPHTLGGNLLRINMLAFAIHSVANVVTKKETQKTITTIKYTDFSKGIISAKENISMAIKKINSAFEEIDGIRENFKKECSDYQYKIPEFDELISNLDSIEKQLKEKQRLIKKQHEKVNKILVENNAKVKRLEKMENSVAA